MDVRTDGDIADSFWWRRTTLARRTPLYDACVSVGLLVAATIVGALLDHPGLAPSIMIVYVFAVQLCAFFTWSRLYCLLSSAAAVALYNFLFVDPRYSLSLIDRVYPGMFFIMFVVSLVSSSIALALRRALAQAAASDRRTHMVLETNRMLQRCADQHQIVHAMATQLARLSGCPVVWYSADAEGDDLLPRATYTAVGDAAPVHELAPQMPPRLSASAYVGTPLDATYGGSAFYGIYLTVRTGDGFVRSSDPASVVGVLAIVAEPDVLTHEERTLADAIVSEGELALDRARAMEAREEAAVLAKNEQLRANLLRSISHDLRTPLTSISGNADVLLDQGSTGTAVLDAQTRRGLLLSIRSDALWLNATVENLLAITKLEGGGMRLSTTLELMDDIVEEALRHVNPAVREHDLVSALDDVRYVLGRLFHDRELRLRGRRALALLQCVAAQSDDQFFHDSSSRISFYQMGLSAAAAPHGAPSPFYFSIPRGACQSKNRPDFIYYAGWRKPACRIACTKRPRQRAAGDFGEK